MVDVYNLSNEQLRAILSKLRIKDLFCCTVVCRRWCEAVFQVCRSFDVQRQEIPWHLTKSYPYGAAIDYFCSPWEGYQCEIGRSFSRIRGKIIGSFYGWLIITNEAGVELINPISRVWIELPSIPITFSMDWNIIRGILCSAPSHNRDHAVILICRCSDLFGDDYIFFARGTDESWTKICLNAVWIYDAIFYRGKLYAAVTLKGGGEEVVVTYDLMAPHVRTTQGALPHTLYYSLEQYFVSVPSGDLWLALEYESEFKICKVDVEQNLIVPTTSLGTYALFLGSGCSVCINSMSFPELKSDVIYFFDQGRIWCYSMKDGSTDKDVCAEHRENLGLLEIWFTPIPAQVDLI